MEFEYDSEYWNNAVREYRLASKFQGVFTMKEIELVIITFHPHNHSSMINDESFHYYQEMRTDWHNVFQHYNLLSYLFSESERIFSKPKTLSVKALKEFNGMYCYTIPPPLIANHNDLVKCVNILLQSKSVSRIYGVFELGSKSSNFHTHFIVQFVDKNGASNFKKKIIKSYDIFKIEQIKFSQQLLKIIRYCHQANKINRGIINTSDLDYYLGLAEGTAEVKFQITNDKRYDLHKL